MDVWKNLVFMNVNLVDNNRPFDRRVFFFWCVLIHTTPHDKATAILSIAFTCSLSFFCAANFVLFGIWKSDAIFECDFGFHWSVSRIAHLVKAIILYSFYGKITWIYSDQARQFVYPTASLTLTAYISLHCCNCFKCDSAGKWLLSDWCVWSLNNKFFFLLSFINDNHGKKHSSTCKTASNQKNPYKKRPCTYRRTTSKRDGQVEPQSTHRNFGAIRQIEFPKLVPSVALLVVFFARGSLVRRVQCVSLIIFPFVNSEHYYYFFFLFSCKCECVLSIIMMLLLLMLIE